MNTLIITPLYAALIAILMAVLSTRAAMLRGKHNVALGNGNIPQLSLAIRHFGNLSEYAAMAIIILGMMEIRGIEPQWLHLYGGFLIAVRLLHPVVLFDQMDAPMWKKAGRFVAGAGTATLLLVGGIVLLIG